MSTIYNTSLTITPSADKKYFSTSINDDGTIVAFGSIIANGGDGQVDIFERNDETETWDLKGSSIVISNEINPDTDHKLGWAIALNADGTRIIIGIPGVNNASPADINGYCDVYEWNGTDWTQWFTINW